MQKVLYLVHALVVLLGISQGVSRHFLKNASATAPRSSAAPKQNAFKGTKSAAWLSPASAHKHDSAGEPVVR